MHIPKFPLNDGMATRRVSILWFLFVFNHVGCSIPNCLLLIPNCLVLSYNLNNLREKNTCSINPLTNIFLNGIFDHPKSIALFLALLHIDKRHVIGWNALKYYDRFGNGWHKELTNIMPCYLRRWQVEYVSSSYF